MDSSKVISILKANGWVLKRCRGDHHTFKKDGVPSIVTVTHPRKDVTIGQLKDISRKSGISFE